MSGKVGAHPRMPAVPACPTDPAELDRLASEPDEGVVAALDRVEGDVVVAGAGGKMGFHLARMVRRALDETNPGAEVVAVSRFSDRSARERFERVGIETVAADLTRSGEVERLPDAGAVFYLAGVKFGTSDDPDTLRRFNEEMPALVAKRYGGVPTVAFSTGCVYPFVAPSTGGSREEDLVGPVGDYAASCLGREQAFLRESEERATPLSLIRLNYAVDLRYGVLVDLASRVHRGEPVDRTTGWFNCIWQGDAIRHTIRSLSLATPAPEACILNVTGERILSVREVANWFGERFGKAVTFTGVEKETAWLSCAEESHRRFGPPGLGEEVLMEWVVEWIENDLPRLGKPTRFEVRDGRY